MNAEILNVIATLLGTGGIAALFFITEKKAAAQIANADKINEQWQLIVRQKEKDFDALNEKYEAASNKIEKLYSDNSELRTRLDEVNTECAVAKLMRCDCIECPKRKPPFGEMNTYNGADGKIRTRGHNEKKN